MPGRVHVDLECQTRLTGQETAFQFSCCWVSKSLKIHTDDDWTRSFGGKERKFKTFFRLHKQFFSRWLIDKRSRVAFKPLRKMKYSLSGRACAKPVLLFCSRSDYRCTPTRRTPLRLGVCSRLKRSVCKTRWFCNNGCPPEGWNIYEKVIFKAFWFYVERQASWLGRLKISIF